MNQGNKCSGGRPSGEWRSSLVDYWAGRDAQRAREEAEEWESLIPEERGRREEEEAEWDRTMEKIGWDCLRFNPSLALEWLDDSDREKAAAAKEGLVSALEFFCTDSSLVLRVLELEDSDLHEAVRRGLIRTLEKLGEDCRRLDEGDPELQGSVEDKLDIPLRIVDPGLGLSLRVLGSQGLAKEKAREALGQRVEMLAGMVECLGSERSGERESAVEDLKSFLRILGQEEVG